MFKHQINKLFESSSVTGYLTLNKIELDDNTYIEMLKLKPGEINIILARTTSFIKNEGEKSKKDLINDILEVLERSSIARKFVGHGLEENYNLFRGFPVRTGDPYETMPDAGNELTLKPSEVFISWTTDATKSREDSSKYDVNKGEPIGGLVVDTHVDSTKILFDVNAVIRSIKSKLQIINTYNQNAAPGKSLSKNNIDFLGTVAPFYHGEYEVLTTNQIVNTRVLDKWTWDTVDGQKKIKWAGSAQKQPQQQETPPQETEEIKQNTLSQQKQQQVNENLKRLFENIDFGESKSEEPGSTIEINDYYISEGVADHFKKSINWISKTSGVTLRGKSMRYMENLIKMYEAKKKVYELSIEYDSIFDPTSKKIELAKYNIEKIDEMISKVKESMQEIESEWGAIASSDTIKNVNPGDIKQTTTPPPAPIKKVSTDHPFDFFAGKKP